MATKSGGRSILRSIKKAKSRHRSRSNARKYGAAIASSVLRARSRSRSRFGGAAKKSKQTQAKAKKSSQTQAKAKKSKQTQAKSKKSNQTQAVAEPDKKKASRKRSRSRSPTKIHPSGVVETERHISEPWLTHIKNGKKVVEVRINRGTYAMYKPGDIVHWSNGTGQVKTTVSGVKSYKSFEDALKGEGLDKVVPGIASLAEGVAVYRQFYNPEDEKANGVLAVTFHK